MSEKMRELFEEFIIRRDGAIWVSVMGESRSYNAPIERDFELWQASRAALVVELPPLVDAKPYACYEGGWNDMHDEARDAIEAAGGTVKP